MSLRHAVYVLFAGVNGAGTSTRFRSDMWTSSEELRQLPRVNSDEILVEQGGDWGNDRDQMRAGKEAVARIHAYLERRVSFNQKTTLAVSYGAAYDTAGTRKRVSRDHALHRGRDG